MSAHRIEAGADIFLMPSRYEPCGLNQLYSLKYGTVPVVHRTGGLADTIVHPTSDSLAAQTANGFVFAEYEPNALDSVHHPSMRYIPQRPDHLESVSHHRHATRLVVDSKCSTVRAVV